MQENFLPISLWLEVSNLAKFGWVSLKSKKSLLLDSSFLSSYRNNIKVINGNSSFQSMIFFLNLALRS